MDKRRDFLLFLALFFCVSAHAAETDTHPYVSAQRALSINRSLLAKAEEEYQKLSHEEAERPLDGNAEKLEGLLYQIKALREDAARLQTELPKNERAAEFLKDVMEHKAVDVEEEKKLNKKLESVYALHEKALALVAEKRYGEASTTYEEITFQSADDDEAYLLLGHTRLLSGEYEKAGNAFMNAVSIDPANREEIPRFYEHILVENPRDDEAYAHLGFVYWMLDRRAEAKNAFRSALQINPANAEAKAALRASPDAQ